MIIHNKRHSIIGQYPRDGRRFGAIPEISFLSQAQTPGNDHHPYAVVGQVPQTGRFRLVLDKDMGIRKRTFKHFELRINYRFKGLVNTYMNGTRKGGFLLNPGSGMTSCKQDSSQSQYDAWKTFLYNVHPPKLLVKIVFFISPVNPEESIENTKTCEQITEQIVDTKGNTQPGCQQEKNAEAKNKNAHSIIHNRSSQPVTFGTLVQILFLGHEHSFISNEQYT